MLSFFVRWASAAIAVVLLLNLAVSADVIYRLEDSLVPGESSSRNTAETASLSWVDDCDSTASPYVVYQNLQPTDRLAQMTGFDSLPDTTGLTLTHPEYLGRAIYNVQGESTFTLCLFSPGGTFASQGDNGWERGYLGDTLENPQRLCYDSQKGRIFLPTDEGDLTYCYSSADFSYGFYPVRESLSRDEWYGVNLSYSFDGTRFTPIPPSSYTMTRYDSSFGSCLFYETYTLTLPSNASHIQVELREIPTVPVVEQKNGDWVVTGSRANSAFSYLILSSVALEGEGSGSLPLPTPFPEEEEEEEDGDRSSSSSSRSSSSGSSTTNNTTSTETVDNRSTSQSTTTNNNTTTTINNYYFLTPEALEYLQEMDPSLLTLGDSNLAYAIGSGLAASDTASSPTLSPEVFLLLVGGCILFLIAVLFKQNK